MRYARAVLAGLAIILVTLLPARPLSGQFGIGVQASSAEKTGFGIGPRAQFDLGPFDAGLRLVGSFEVFFPGQTLLQDIAFDSPISNVDLEGDPDYWELNVNVLYTLGFPVIPITPYVGGGLNIARTEVTGTTDGLFDLERSDTGVNVLAGLEVNVLGVAPFLEFRYSFQGGEQWVISGGVVF